MAATGDVRGNLERLRVQLHSIQYPHTFDVQGLKQGIPAVILPLVHYALLGYSRHLARFLSGNGYELYAKSDLRFMESTLKFLRQEFNYRSALTIAQIFSRGYAERKLLFLCDIIQISKRKHCELLKQAHGDRIIRKGVRATSPHRQSKAWEGTLKRPIENEDANAGPRGVPAVRSDSSHRSGLPEIVPEFHANELFKGSNVSSRMSTSTVNKSVGDHASHSTIDYSEGTQRPIKSVSSSACHEREVFEIDPHEELCQKIIDMAGRLDACFSALEDGITNAKDALQQKLVTLDGRVGILETVLLHQERNVDGAGLKTQEQKINLDGQTRVDYNHMSDHQQLLNCGHSSHCSRFQDDAQNCLNALNSGLSSARRNSSIVEPPPFVTTDKNRPCNGGKNMQAAEKMIRDISSTHQRTEKTLPNVHVENEPARERRNLHPFQEKKSSNTQEFIEGMKARFNRTLELFN